MTFNSTEISVKFNFTEIITEISVKFLHSLYAKYGHQLPRLFPFDKKHFSSYFLPFFLLILSHYFFHSSHIYEMGLYAFTGKEILSGLI